MDNLYSAFTAAAAMMVKVIPSLLTGLFLSNLLTVRKIPDALLGVLPVISKYSKLPPLAVLSVLLSVGDRTAGMAVLETVRRQVDLTNTQMLAAVLAAKAPSVLQFFLFQFIPITLALFPRDAALRFLGMYFAVFVMISLAGLLLSRSYPYRGNAGGGAGPAGTLPDITWGQAAVLSLRRSLRSLIHMAGWMFIMSFAVMLFIKSGVLWNAVHQLPFIDVKLLPVFAAGLISMVGGVAAAGTAYAEGYVTAAGIAPLLFVISILHNVYDLFSAALPRYTAVYGRRLGVQLAVYSFLITQAVMSIGLFLVYFQIM
jgi:hypothetical protein